MTKQEKVSIEARIEAAKACAEGKQRLSEVAKDLAFKSQVCNAVRQRSILRACYRYRCFSKSGRAQQSKSAVQSDNVIT